MQTLNKETQFTDYLMLVDDTGEIAVCTLAVSKGMNPLGTLVLRQCASSQVPEVMTFLQESFAKYPRMTVTSVDASAVALAMSMSAQVASTDPVIVEAWTTLTFEVEAQAETKTGRPAKARFLGKNLGGLKALVSASAVTMTITRPVTTKAPA
jgi:hypothetical protein